MSNFYQKKYQKYKLKYLNLLNQSGGSMSRTEASYLAERYIAEQYIADQYTDQYIKDNYKKLISEEMEKYGYTENGYKETPEIITKQQQKILEKQNEGYYWNENNIEYTRFDD
jgi:hypothetical protein